MTIFAAIDSGQYDMHVAGVIGVLAVWLLIRLIEGRPL